MISLAEGVGTGSRLFGRLAAGTRSPCPYSLDHADGEPRLSGAAVDLCHIFTQQTGLRAGDWCTVDAGILEGRVDMTAFSHAEKQLKRKRRSL